MLSIHLRSAVAGCVAVLVLLSGCASLPDDPDARAAVLEANDPLEPVNRGVYAFNETLDRNAIRPVAVAYRDTVPEGLRGALRNFLRNLRSPIILVNNLLQGDFEAAGRTMGRFVINTTVGGGFFDVAGEYGDLHYQDEDFGQTLAVWGVPEGPYLVLPVAGPSTVRDTVGYAVEFLTDPLSLFLMETDATWAMPTRYGLSMLDSRAELIDVTDDINRTSLDSYATLRSLYRQNRAREIGLELDGQDWDAY